MPVVTRTMDNYQKLDTLATRVDQLTAVFSHISKTMTIQFGQIIETNDYHDE